jgi:hypothetical protein
VTDIFLTGTQGQSTDQPAGPSIPAIPSWDGQIDSLPGIMDALTGAVRQLSGHFPAQNNTGPSSAAYPGGGKVPSSAQLNNTKDDNKKKPQYTEVNRQTKDVKITNPDDATQYVIVTQIVALTMQDNVTKEQWIWKL